MYALRRLVIVPMLGIMLVSASLLAQMTTDTAAADASAVRENTITAGDTNGKDMSRYYWIGGVLFIAIIFGVGYVVRSKRKKGDDPHLSGDSINNPASGI